MSFGAEGGLICAIDPSFDIRTVALEPGGSVAYDEAEWRDALVTVEAGELELVMSCGRSCLFGPGDMLWFQGLPLARLNNPGDEPVVLVAAARDREVR